MERVGSVLIVGGGSSGWMTAQALKANLPELDVTLIEASDIPTVGVGEATLNTLHGFLLPAGIHEDEFLYETSGSIKLGILYRGWSDRDYWHPFGEVWFPPPYLARWMQERVVLGARAKPFDEYGGLGTFELARACRAPKFFGDPEYHTRTLLYGYHIDAGLFAELLKKRAKAAGVRQLVDNVIKVDIGPAGITGVQTRANGTLTADLYIDCSGFRSLLLYDGLLEPFQSFERYLPNDSAVAFGRMRGEDNELRPFTSANTMRSGWSWNIPLWHRDGTGYVYSSAFCTKEEAECEQIEFLGGDAAISEANHLKMRVGKSRRTWVANCVAVGLAGGFIEPLESTGLALVAIALDQLCRSLQGGGYDNGDRTAFNKGFSALYDGIRDFLVLHFVTARRDDTDYWRALHNDPALLPPAVAEVLERWQRGEPPLSAPLPFQPGSWAYILDGNGLWPRSFPAGGDAGTGIAPAVAAADDEAAVRRRDERLDLAGRLPSLRQYLADVRRRYEAGERATGPLPTPDEVWAAHRGRSFWPEELADHLPSPR
jgi:tryptophan halogenase